MPLSIGGGAVGGVAHTLMAQHGFSAYYIFAQNGKENKKVESDAIAVRPSSKAAHHGLCVYLLDPAVANNNVSKNRARSTACAHCASVSLFSFRKEKRRSDVLTTLSSLVVDCGRSW